MSSKLSAASQKILAAYERAKKDRIDRSTQSTAEINAAKKREEVKAIEVLKNRALTTREKEQFNQTFGNVIKRTITDSVGIKEDIEEYENKTEKQVDLDEVLIKSGIGSVLDETLQKEIDLKFGDLFKVSESDIVDEKTKARVIEIDRLIADATARISSRNANYPRVPTRNGRINYSGGAYASYQRNVAAIQSANESDSNLIQQLTAEKNTLINQFALVPKVLAEIQKQVNELTNDIAREPLTNELKTEIKLKMELVNKAITKASELNIPFTARALTDIGFIMQRAANRLNQAIQTQRIETKVIGDSLQNTIFNLGNSIIQPINEIFSSLFAVDENIIVNHEIAKLRTQQKIMIRAKQEGLI